DSEINFEDEPDRNSEWDLGDCAQTKGIVKKIYKRGVEVACVPIAIFGQNMPILTWVVLKNSPGHFRRDVRCENIMMTHYMEPKIANLHFAKHVSE
ncbi:13872_t:CDS:2, partial [Gigaspora rosea]